MTTRPPHAIIALTRTDDRSVAAVLDYGRALRSHGYVAVLATTASIVDDDTHVTGVGQEFSAEETLVSTPSSRWGLRMAAARVGADLVVVPQGDHIARQLARGNTWDSSATLLLVMRRVSARRRSLATSVPRAIASQRRLAKVSQLPNVEIVLRQRVRRVLPWVRIAGAPSGVLLEPAP